MRTFRPPFPEDLTPDGIDLTIPVGAIYEIEGGVVRRAAFLPDQAAARARLAG